jgi:ElaB/YqjD/DUF883 family membrane-anchored ribosome-binding protein
MAQETSGLTKFNNAEDAAPVTLGDSEPESVTSEETERLHSEIEETRENMSETIDAIQERLSLSNLSEQVSEKVGDVIESAKETIYDATIGKVVNFMKQTKDGVKQTSMGKTIMANPIPFALIGAGSAMLIYNSYSKKGRTNQMSKYRTQKYFAPVESGHESAGFASNTAEKISDSAGSAYETVSKKAGAAMETISQKANDTYVGAADMAGRAYEKVGEFGSSAKESYDYYVEEKPLAVAAAALAVGAAVGFAIPSTNYEGRMMGDARDELLSKAEDTATEFVDKAKEVASDAVQAVKKETNSPSTGTQNF